MDVTLWPIEKVTPYARNARKIPPQAVDKVAASIQEFGWRQPIVVDADGVIVAGHTRLLAAQKLGLTHVPVHVATGLTPTQIKAYRLMDNRSHQETTWDDELLTIELAELKDLAVDLDLTGFECREIDALFASQATGLTPADDVPAVPDVPVSQPGDLWLCGGGRRQHRVLCADSTNMEAVARLLGNRKPSLMVTDPPYGVELDSEWRDRA